MINGKEAKVLEGMARDIRFDLKTYQEGSLTLEAFVDRVESKAEDIEQLLGGIYPFDE